VALEQDASAVRARLADAEARVRLGQLLGRVLAVRDVLGRQNYGQAQDMASEFFDRVRSEATAAPDAFRPMLGDVLSRRDAVTAALTKADAGVLDVVRTIEGQLRRGLGYPLPQDPSAK
jgi:hypothetical protein